MIRVLNIVPNGHLGGRERQVYVLSKYMRDRDTMTFDLYFIKPEGPFYEACRALGIGVLMPRSSGWFGRMIGLWQTIRRYDIVNFWGIGFGAFAVALGTGRTIVYTLTGARTLLGKDLRAAVRSLWNAGDSAAQSKTGMFGGLRKLVRKTFFSAFLRRCDGIVVPSKYMQQLAVRFYRLPPQKISVIKNFIDCGEIVPSKTASSVKAGLGLPLEAFVVGVVARLDRRKRLDRLIAMQKEIRKERRTHVVIVGNGSQEVRAELERSIDAAGLNGMVHLIGGRTDVYDLINCFDVSVLPSDREAFGIFLLESLFLGKPTVVFEDGGGVREVIEHEKTGYVVRNPTELARLIEAIQDGKVRTDTVIENGRHSVKNQYDLPNGAAYERFFLSMKDGSV